jgi:bacterioferritin
MPENDLENSDLDTSSVLEKLDRILALELAGVVRYTHYSFMVFGYGRIPIVSWLRSQADESLLHAHEAGELITQLGGMPSLEIGPLLDEPANDVGVILEESLRHEDTALRAYVELLEVVKGHSVMLEEYATRLISDETRHAGDVKKMLRPPGG